MAPMFLSDQNLIPGELVNGSVGQVIKFSTPAHAAKEHTEVAKTEGTRMPPNDTIWPVVRFICGREMMCVPQEFTVNNADGGMEACRQQVRSLPLHPPPLHTRLTVNSCPLSWPGLLAYINLRVRLSSVSRSTLSERSRKVKVRYFLLVFII